ncbi:cytochrome-c peroxidase [Rhodocytophaga rosea]|uniref:Cytochrome-c peroxidase n=1 Tax=Rhodocytophaga rosea TaxID=2704465 RepID=A0A6C0GQM9_9BACT|nr:cytochrome c peroxidase [Rhodocytophaga rosea]QHT70164.1 cytochrome-c peroxidase [Rhodocytophaga rosea]
MRFFSKKIALSIAILIWVFIFSTAGKMNNIVSPDPYPLTIPHKFGSTFTIPADNPLTMQGIALGRMLFYEKKLSGDNTISCANCHQQRFAFTDGQAFSFGVAGKKGRRSAMSLVNLLWAKRFFWDGRASTLEEQALIPIQDTLEMHQSLDGAVKKLQRTKSYPKLFEQAFGTKKITADLIAKALAQFERTLISSNSRYDKFLRGEIKLSMEEKRGMDLFMTHPEPIEKLRGANCGDCHGTYKVFMEGFHNNGLDSIASDKGREMITQKERDRAKFRAPSLRNIAVTGPYMHDGRFKSLEEVLDHYNEHIRQSNNLDPLIIEATNEIKGKSLQLSPSEKKMVITFLHTLTDSTFITNPEFSDPFRK